MCRGLWRTDDAASVVRFGPPAQRPLRCAITRGAGPDPTGDDAPDEEKDAEAQERVDPARCVEGECADAPDNKHRERCNDSDIHASNLTGKDSARTLLTAQPTRSEETKIFEPTSPAKGLNNAVLTSRPSAGKAKKHGEGLIPIVRASKKPLRSDLEGLPRGALRFSPSGSQTKMPSGEHPWEGRGIVAGSTLLAAGCWLIAWF